MDVGDHVEDFPGCCLVLFVDLAAGPIQDDLNGEFVDCSQQARIGDTGDPGTPKISGLP